jgi:uncharacterized membrane protein
MPQATNGEADDKTLSLTNKLELFYSKHMFKIWIMIIFIPIIVITIGCIILPEIFYDQFIWRYFWGTIEADAKEQSFGEVDESYNPVNTIAYAFILIAVIYWLYKMFKKFKIDLDIKFFIAIIPFIILGSLTRALEDAELFFAPIVYLFIAPIIYIFIGVGVIGLILLAEGIRRYCSKNGLEKGFQVIVWVHVISNLVYLCFYFFFNDQFSYILNPIVPILLSIFILLVYWKYLLIKRIFELPIFIFSIGLWLLLIGMIVLSQWQSIPSWSAAYLDANPGKDVQIRLFVFLGVFVLTIFATFLVYIIAKLLIKKYPRIIAFTAGVNLTLFFGHFLDASATFIAVDFFPYDEKHVLPNFMIQVFNTAAVMYVLKAAIIIAVVYFIDIQYKNDFKGNPTLTGLVKIAILVLGLAPGLRDVLRLGMGV